MRFMVIGEGLLGCALIDAIAEAGYEVFGSSRDILSSKYYLDLARPIDDLPEADVIFIVGAVASYRKCEGNQEVWVINADSPVQISRLCLERGSFPIFVSSDSIEFMSNAYTRMKSYAESCIIPMGGAVVRPSRFGPENVATLCHLMIRVGLDRKPGVYRWA